MRLSCEYETEEIPVGYHMMFVSLVKETLKRSDQELQDKLYNYDNNRSNKQSKDFNFAVHMQGFEKEEEVFKINDKVIFNFTTPDYELGIKFYNGLLNLKEFEYDSFSLKKSRINLTKEKEINSEEVKFKTLAPLCIKDENNQFLDLDDENYVKELNYIADIILKNYRGHGLKRKLDFEALNMEKVVVKQKIKEFTENTGRDYYFVNSFKGNFKLIGNSQDLQDLYMLGLGFKRNQGFGMLEVI